MKKKSFLFGMLSLMMAAMLCGVMSSCIPDDPFTHPNDDSMDDGNEDVVPWDGSISGKYFPDRNFRNYLLEQDYGEDEMITEEEILSITEINVSRRDIKNLKGIEYFTALTKLRCSSNQLTSLDVSKNTALTELACYNNQLTSLDVSKNTKLTYLDCSDNHTYNGFVLAESLSNLDVSGCVALTELYCYNNQLTSLDVSKNTALTELYCYNNQLTSLDVSNNTALTGLHCGGNQLTSLDVSNNTALTSLSCWSNQLTSLDVSKNTKLTSLDCSGNQLTSLDVSKNTALTRLWCYSNQIKGAAMDALISGLPQNKTDETYPIYVYNSEYDGNVCTKAQVVAAKAKGWTPYYTEGSWQQPWLEYEGYEKSIEINEENFPDENFRNWLLQQDYGQDGKLTEDEINGITSIDVYSKNISSLKGIEYFTALTELFCDRNPLTSLDVSKNTALTQLSCYSNQLTSLDVSNNTALTELYCYYNRLTSLDVSKNTALTGLYCYFNQLTSLDVSKNTALTTLWCYYNQLTSLDVSNNTALTELFCDRNQLTSLDVSKNTALTSLDCWSNQIKGEAMDVLISGLPQNKTDETYPIYVYWSGNDGNVCTKAQVAAVKAKGWTPYYYYTNGGDWQEYEGSDE